MPALAKATGNKQKLMAQLEGNQFSNLYRFTVEQYQRMIAEGIFKKKDRVMLLEGLIVPKVTHNPLHDDTVWKIQTCFLGLLPGAWIVRVQSAIKTADSQPEPDVVVAQRLPAGYGQTHPRPENIGLVVEVADTTLAEDRGIQARIYARARLPVYWIVNLVDNQVEVFTQPLGGKKPFYRQRQICKGKEKIPLVLGGREIGPVSVRQLLP